MLDWEACSDEVLKQWESCPKKEEKNNLGWEIEIDEEV